MTYQAVKDREVVDELVDADVEDGAEKVRRFDAESIGAQVRRDAYKTAFRLRRQIMPHAVTGTVLGGGLAAQAVCASGSAQPAGVATILALTAFPAALGVWAKVRRRRPRWARRALIGGLGAAAWLTVAPYGVGPEQIAALVGFEVALAARWWQTVRIGYPGARTVVDAEIPGTAEQIVADWNAYVGAQGKALAKSTLTAPEATRHGFAFDLSLDRGTHTLTTAIGALEKIAGGLDRDISELIVESHPFHKSPARCRFQVITDSPITGDVVFDGPRRGGGLLDIGPYADGSGEAPWRIYGEDSMWGGVIIGKSGSGKSRVAENLAVSALSGGDTVVWYLDPQYGASSPGLARTADWCVSLEGADAMLEAALAIGDARGQENSAEGWQGFTPSPERPGLLIFVEECHRPFADNKVAARWAYVAREFRKVGIALVALSQFIGLETFGSHEPLRGGVMAGNALCMKVNSNNGQQLMAGLTVNPLHLPDIPGYAYTVGTGDTGIRTAPFRNRLIAKGQAEGWLAAQPRASLDVLSQTATLLAGTAYRDRHATSESGRSQSRAWVDTLRDGRLPAGATATRFDPPSSVGEMGVIVTFPRGITLEDLQRPVEPVALLDLTDSQRAVLDAVAAGIDRPSAIEKAVGLSHRRVQELLKELLDAEPPLLVQPKYGRYQRAA
jgi:hypothetical protein